MSGRAARLLGLALPLLAAAAVHAQMPDLRQMSGKPLPSAELPAGTVTVRVARKMPANAVAGVEVIAVITNAGGDSRKRSEKTDAQGRATFGGVQPGSEFRAEVTVDGDRLETEKFAVPAQGGTRTMLIAGLGAGPAAGSGSESPPPAAAGGAGDFSLGAATGKAEPDIALPPKTLHVHLLDEAGKPIAGKAVSLGQVDKQGAITVHQAASDAAGVARFEGLATGDTMGYAAVIEHQGMRLGTEPFRMPDSPGMRAEIRALGRTSDPAAVRLGAGSRQVMMLREGAFEVQVALVLDNASGRLYDPGPGGIDIPLPPGFVNAQGMDGNTAFEVRERHGLALRTAVPPGRMEVRYGYILPYTGSSLDLEQAMPIGLGGLTLVVERLPGLTVSGPTLGRREERTSEGRNLWVIQSDAVRPGGKLELSFSGLPSSDTTARSVTGVIAVLLALAGIFAARRPGEVKKAEANRSRLVERREKLFAELIAIERARRDGAAGDDTRRREAVTRLETVYRELAALDEPR